MIFIIIIIIITIIIVITLFAQNYFITQTVQIQMTDSKALR